MDNPDNKNDIDVVEKASASDQSAQGIDSGHSQYLVARHGTSSLDPLPDPSDADPLNWPKTKKITVLLLVGFHAFMATFTAAALLAVFVNVAMDLDVSIQRASYLTSLVIAILGGAPLIWKPLANTWGRRPIFIISLIGSLAGNIGCANSPTYATMALCRAITGFFISPAAAVGSGIVVELFFKAERARYIGFWAVLVTLGVPVAPVIFGVVAFHVDYRWIYYILAITNGVQLILWLAFGYETLYFRNQPSNSKPSTMFKFRRINPAPLSVVDFVQPLRFFARPCVVLPTISYTMIFAFAAVLIPVEIPELYPVKFHFNSQQVGLQNISIVIGAILGEIIGGRLSDYWMSLGAKRHDGVRPEPEFRLWLSYIASPLVIIGVAIFLVYIDESTHWTVVPLVGAAIAAVGNQIATTVLITYAVDSDREQAASIGVFITFVRQIWGFIGPFWYPQMLANVGFKGSVGIITALIAGISFPVSIALQARGKHWR